jgi:formate dehydrogenase maturation protein FdhE
MHQTAGDEEVVKMECQKCHKSKELSRLTIARDEDGTIQRECIECQTGSKELEDLHVKLENEMFAAADKIWNRILGVQCLKN